MRISLLTKKLTRKLREKTPEKLQRHKKISKREKKYQKKKKPSASASISKIFHNCRNSGEEICQSSCSDNFYRGIPKIAFGAFRPPLSRLL
jgi:hypothetical protein